MRERERYEPGVPCWVESLQPDPRAAVAFYEELMGWEFGGPGVMPGEPAGSYFVARAGGRDVAGIGSHPEGDAAPGASWTTHIRVDGADAAARRVAGAGGTVVVEPFDVPPAGRVAVLADSAGAIFCAWEAGAREGAQLVNAPGAWAMSSLDTPDVDGAKAFYAEAFGWQPEPLRFGDAEVTLWRLPGYVGGLSEQPVPRDVVAVMGPPATGAPARWNVDFWVEDADATAARAVRLGGTVVVEPHDVPGFRNAVVADPQGAVLSVSRLMAGG
jgi:uncharacterized protein